MKCSRQIFYYKMGDQNRIFYLATFQFTGFSVWKKQLYIIDRQIKYFYSKTLFHVTAAPPISISRTYYPLQSILQKSDTITFSRLCVHQLLMATGMNNVAKSRGVSVHCRWRRDKNKPQACVVCLFPLN